MTKESTLTVSIFQTMKIKQNETRMINIVPQIYTELMYTILQEEHSLLNCTCTLQEEHSLLNGTCTVQEEHSLLNGTCTLQEEHSLLNGLQVGL